VRVDCSITGSMFLKSHEVARGIPHMHHLHLQSPYCTVPLLRYIQGPYLQCFDTLLFAEWRSGFGIQRAERD